MWSGRSPQVAQLVIFGQNGFIRSLTTVHRRVPRETPARYLQILNETGVLVESPDGRHNVVQAKEFRPKRQDYDPCGTTHTVVISIRKWMRTIPKNITAGTTAWVTTSHARKYLDEKTWAKAHDAAIEKLDNERAVQWNPWPQTKNRTTPNNRLVLARI